jgi:membrane protease YdiL (CAAX protease family)
LQEQTNRFGANPISRGMQFTLFLTAMAWAAAANMIAERAAAGIAVRFQLGVIESLLESAFLLFLVVIGLKVLDWISTRSRYSNDVLPLPVRTGWQREWAVGAAIGWGLCLVAVLPVLLSGHLHGRILWNSNTPVGMIVAVVGMLAGTLVLEVVFHGYAFRRLIDSVGPSWAAVMISGMFALLVVGAAPPRDAMLGVVDCTLFGILLAMAWLRTHGLWLGWSLHFAYRAVMAVGLGLPVAGHGEFGSPIDMYTSGPRWLTGGAFGLDAALLTGLVMVGGMVVLYRATRDYAWEYTYQPIVPAGYEVTVAPPPAHVAMENAAAPPPLVQILPSTPQTRSVVDAPPRA